MRLRQVATALAGGLVLAGVMATDALAQRDDWRRGHRAEWELLGEKSVGFVCAIVPCGGEPLRRTVGVR